MWNNASRGFAENAVCPKCDGYTQQEIVRRGVRRCLGCRTEFLLKDVQRVSHGKVLKPRGGPHGQ